MRQPSALYITYYNDNASQGGVNHCFISADLLRSNLNNQELGWDLGSLNTASNPSDNQTGRQIFYANLTEQLDFSTSYYWVDIQLHRDAANAACSPTLVGTYLGDALIQ